jgi:trk system potassium uptake protein TrkA
MTIQGDMREAHTFLNIEEKIDFYIAVTNNDEINLISTIVVKDILEVENTIVRLSNTSYMATNFQKTLNISRVIFPFKLSASAMAKLLEFSKANNIKDFPFSDYILVSITVKNPKITKVNEIEEEDVKVIGAERNEEFIFLNEEDEIQENDLLYIFGNREKIKQYLNLIDTISPEEIKNILIYGANELGIEIAKILLNFDMNIKILERDEDLAMKAAEILGENVSIINSSYEDEEMLLNEGVQYSDIAITASLKDESNIIKSLQARKLGIKKIITIII